MLRSKLSCWNADQTLVVATVDAIVEVDSGVEFAEGEEGTVTCYVGRIIRRATAGGGGGRLKKIVSCHAVVRAGANVGTVRSKRSMSQFLVIDSVVPVRLTDED